MTTTRRTTTETDSLFDRPGRSSGRGVVGVVLAMLVLAMSACGGDSDVSSAVGESASASSSSETDGSTEAAPAPAAAIDLTAVSSCIEAANIVVGPTSYSDSFLAEQQIAATLDLGALGIEFGGGQLFVFETVERADERYASFSSDPDAAVRQDGTTVLKYQSAVQDEVADIVMACAAG